MSYKAVWENKAEGQFIYEEEGKKLAFMDLLLTDSGKLVIKHTEVDPSQEGKGIAKKLLEEVASFARANNYKILPVCPFAKNVMYKYPEQYKDLL
tara:strand:- start:996 stop:1280 length:285 start_codon:yes stop_codon:yes gene_type:complete